MERNRHRIRSVDYPGRTYEDAPPAYCAFINTIIERIRENDGALPSDVSWA